MRFKDLQIKWNPTEEGLATLNIAPIPAKQALPQWYVNMSNKGDETKSSPCIINGEFAFNTTLKRCQPFADALTFGYVQLAWQDIFIQQDEDNNIDFGFPVEPSICKIRESQNTNYPINPAFNPIEFSWMPKYYPELPNGYSCLITHPINRYDLPFITLSGVVDSDDYVISHSFANLPFYVRKGFTGIIPAGTPLWQIIPFKRDPWVSSVNLFDKDFYVTQTNRVKRHLLNAYRKEHWKKKSFK